MHLFADFDLLLHFYVTHAIGSMEFLYFEMVFRCRLLAVGVSCTLFKGFA